MSGSSRSGVPWRVEPPFPPVYDPKLGYRLYTNEYRIYLSLCDKYSIYLRTGNVRTSARRKPSTFFRMGDLKAMFGKGQQQDEGSIASEPPPVQPAHEYELQLPSPPASVSHGSTIHAHPGQSISIDFGKTATSVHSEPTSGQAPRTTTISVVPRADEVLDHGLCKNDVIGIMIATGVPFNQAVTAWAVDEDLRLCHPDYIKLWQARYFGDPKAAARLERSWKRYKFALG